MKLICMKRKRVLSHMRDMKQAKSQACDNVVQFYTKIFDLNSMIDQSGSSNTKNCVLKLCNKVIS